MKNEIVRREQVVPIIGRREDVRRALAAARDRGDLLNWSVHPDPALLSGDRIRVEARMLVREEVAAPGRRERFAAWRRDHPVAWRWTWAVSAALFTFGALFALALAVIHALVGVFTAASMNLPAVIGGAVVVLVVLGLIGKATRSGHDTCGCIMVHVCHHRH